MPNKKPGAKPSSKQSRKKGDKRSGKQESSQSSKQTGKQPRGRRPGRSYEDYLEEWSAQTQASRILAEDESNHLYTRCLLCQEPHRKEDWHCPYSHVTYPADQKAAYERHSSAAARRGGGVDFERHSAAFKALKAIMFDVEAAIPKEAVRSDETDSSRKRWQDRLKNAGSLRRLAECLLELEEKHDKDWLCSSLDLNTWRAEVAKSTTPIKLKAKVLAFDRGVQYKAPTSSPERGPGRASPPRLRSTQRRHWGMFRIGMPVMDSKRKLRGTVLHYARGRLHCEFEDNRIRRYSKKEAFEILTALAPPSRSASPSVLTDVQVTAGDKRARDDDVAMESKGGDVTPPSKRSRAAPAAGSDPKSTGRPLYRFRGTRLGECAYCKRDVSTSVRVQCLQCAKFELCLVCYAQGAVILPHKISHRVTVECSEWSALRRERRAKRAPTSAESANDVLCELLPDGAAASLRSDPEAAIATARSAAEGGDPESMCTLGLLLSLAADPDASAAVKHLEKAAERGCAKAMLALGVCCDRGCGGATGGSKRARGLYEQAAKSGVAAASVLLAGCLASGRGGTVAAARGHQLLEQASKAATPRINYLIGLVFAELGNASGAIAAFERAVANPVSAHPRAAWNLAVILRRASSPGAAQPRQAQVEQQNGGSTEDSEKEAESTELKRRVVELYELGAAKREPRCMYNLALCLVRGDGVARDPARAKDLQRRAADAGHEQALFSWALSLEADGKCSEAAELYARAANAGHVPSMYNLALLMDEGVEGGEEEAAQWYRRAADAGDPRAMFNLAVLYTKGRGVDASGQKAEELFYRAAGLDHGQA